MKLLQMHYLTLKVRIKCYYSTRKILSYVFSKKQTHKQNALLHHSKLSAGNKIWRWLSVVHIIISQRYYK